MIRFFPKYSSLCQSQTIQILLWWYFITLVFSINFSWNPGWNILIWRKFILIFHMWIGKQMWFIPLAVLCHWITIIKRCIFHVMFLCSFIRYYGEIFYGGCWYSIMNVTLMILFFTSICIKAFFEVLLLQFWDGRYIVKFDEMISVVFHNNHWWHWFLPMNINFVLDYFSIAVWLTLYKHTRKNLAMRILLEKYVMHEKHLT